MVNRSAHVATSILAKSGDASFVDVASNTGSDGSVSAAARVSRYHHYSRVTTKPGMGLPQTSIHALKSLL